MRYTKKCTPSEAATAPRGSLIEMIDYMLPEVGEIEPIAGYFLRMARAALVDSARGGGDQRVGS